MITVILCTINDYIAFWFSSLDSAPLHIPGSFLNASFFHVFVRGPMFPTFGTNALSASRNRTSWFPSRKMSWCTQWLVVWVAEACDEGGVGCGEQS